MTTAIIGLEKLRGGPRDGALLRYSLGNEWLKAGHPDQAADCFRAVSYTHLDVYKRQIITDTATYANQNRSQSDYHPISDVLEEQYWNESGQVSGSLKHAGQYTDRWLSPENTDNNLLRTKDCSAYQDIAPDDLGNEDLNSCLL